MQVFYIFNLLRNTGEISHIRSALLNNYVLLTNYSTLKPAAFTFATIPS